MFKIDNIKDLENSKKNNFNNYMTLIRVAMCSYYGNEDEISKLFTNIMVLNKEDSVDYIKKITKKYKWNEQDILEKFNSNNIITIGKRKKSICLNNCENINTINLLELLTCEINYIYNFKNNCKNIRSGIYLDNREKSTDKEQVLKEIFNILQTEKIIKIILELLENKELNKELVNDVEVNLVLSSEYKCIFYQTSTNMIRPLYKLINTNNYGDFIKYITEIKETENIEKIIILLNEIDNMLLDYNDGKLLNKQFEFAENYRLIKDLVKKICLKIKNKKKN